MRATSSAVQAGLSVSSWGSKSDIFRVSIEAACSAATLAALAATDFPKQLWSLLFDVLENE